MKTGSSIFQGTDITGRIEVAVGEEEGVVFLFRENVTVVLERILLGQIVQ